MIAFAQFHNALRILRSIDLDELQAAGAFVGAEKPAAAGIARRDMVDRWNAWVSFRDDPFRFFITCDDETAEKIWVVICKRAGWTP